MISGASAYDRIGESISISGNTAIIGASGDASPIGGSRGTAYMFTRNAVTGVWTQQQQLWDPNGASSDQFGVSVAISGDNAIVGTGRDDSAFAYVRDPGTGLWTGQKLLASDGGRIFGASVSIDGDRAIIGASGAYGIVDYAGAAYVYTNSVVTAPEIIVTDSVAPPDDLTVAFGDVTELESSDQIVTITNDGTADLTLGNITVAVPFTIERPITARHRC